MPKDLKDIIKENPNLVTDIFNRGLTEGSRHRVPSAETINRFEKLDHCLQDLTEAIKRLEVHSIERGKKVDEMYEYFVKGGNVVWFVKWIFGSAAAVGGLIIMTKSILSNGN